MVNTLKKTLACKVFSCETCENFTYTYIEEELRMIVSVEQRRRTKFVRQPIDDCDGIVTYCYTRESR